MIEGCWGHPATRTPHAHGHGAANGTRWLWSYPVEGLVRKLATSSDVLYAAVDTPNSGFALYALRRAEQRTPGPGADARPGNA
jgi:hypothetical protein